MWAMTSRDKQELDAYRATGLTPEQAMQLASQANGDMAPIPFADHVVEYEGEWCGVTGIPGLLEDE